MSEVTIVCCYNNEKVYGDFVETLESQTCPYELIGINNVGNKNFKSCASAYNSVIAQVKTKYVIYSHQDILLNKPDLLEKFMSHMNKINSDDIIGAAGVKLDFKLVITNLIQFDNNNEFVPPGRTYVNFDEDEDMIECHTLDECFFGGYTEHFKINPFDEIICNNWHLYAAEACLRTKSKLGGKCWISSVPIIHLSPGNPNPSLRWGFFRLCKKYAKSFPFIKTTCLASGTNKRGLLRCLWRYIRTTVNYYCAKFIDTILKTLFKRKN